MEQCTMTRRELACGIWSTLSAVPLLAANQARQDSQGPEPIRSKPDVVIHDGSYSGWPWVAAGTDGTLYCVFREGTVHGYSAAGRIMFTTSRDKGKTWSRSRVIVDAPNVDDRNVAIAELPGGELLLTYNTYTRAEESLAKCSRSTDGGRTWSAPAQIDRPNTRTKAAAVVLAGGDVILPYYVAPGNGSLAALSTDRGHTWRTVQIPDTEGFVGDEWDILEVRPGRLIGVIRNSHPQTNGTFWVTSSHDGGRSWSVPRPTNVRSKRHPSPAQITRMDNTPILIYADRRMVSVSAVRTRDPEFLHWDVDGRLPCYLYNADESPIIDGSYPVSAATGLREKLVVDYEIRKGSARITGYFVSFPKDW